MGVHFRAHNRRGGFTLIELLVAVSIFIILTTLTVATFNLNVGSERISASARQVQAMLEGARSRAFKLQKPVGVRFLLDRNFPSEISSMIYVTSADSPSGGTYQTGRLRFVDLDGDLSDANLIPGIQQAAAPNSIPWRDMQALQILRAGVRIRIPAGSGPWYTISSENFLAPVDTVMRLNETPLDVASFGLLGQNFASNSGAIYDYEIDLSTVMVPLQGEDPVQLPTGSVIDLIASKAPSNWYFRQWFANTPYEIGDWVAAETANGTKSYRAIAAGTSDNALPNWNSANNNGDVIVDGTVEWQCYDAPLRDVIFTPQGTLMGEVSAEGVLHFTISETRDLRETFDGVLPGGLHAWDTNDRDLDGGPDQLGTSRVITVYSASGAVNVSQIDQTDSNSDGVADNLFRYALEGATSK